jgi:hypothetical protein
LLCCGIVFGGLDSDQTQVGVGTTLSRGITEARGKVARRRVAGTCLRQITDCVVDERDGMQRVNLG